MIHFTIGPGQYHCLGFSMAIKQQHLLACVPLRYSDAELVSINSARFGSPTIPTVVQPNSGGATGVLKPPVGDLCSFCRGSSTC
jgi:hypothetical protein